MSRETKRYEVVFRKSAPAGSAVSVCGDFNGWDASALPLHDGTGHGDYQCRAALPSGVWRYKFVVDGIWCLDDTNGEFAASGFGQYENLLQVPGGRSQRV